MPIIPEERTFLSRTNKILFWLAAGLAVLALTFSAGLLAGAAEIGPALRLSPGAISALPLLLAGLSFLIVQPMIRPRYTELIKNIMLVATFLLWGIVQLMAQNPLSKTLGDVVIVLYVLDLVWTILASLQSARKQPA